jgi:septal ring factor EnvC (AmiA/AmiB activator)
VFSVFRGYIFGEIMKIKSVLFLTVLAVLCLFSNGCQEGMSSDQVRMAQLVGNENLQLKKQLKDKDSQINDKNTLINNKDTQIAKLQQQLEQSKQETVKAQERLSQIEKTFADATASYQQQLEQCNKNMDAKPVPCPEVEEKYAAEFTSLLQKWTACETELEKYKQAAADADQTDNK